MVGNIKVRLKIGLTNRKMIWYACYIESFRLASITADCATLNKKYRQYKDLEVQDSS